jgi:prepilin-type N-terminal cleavage/methylation domain-containing protein
MRRARGFTLMEVMIAMALTTIITAAVLAIVRTQLIAFEMNDQVTRTQQNARAAMDFVETAVRRACGGIASGGIGVNVPGKQGPAACLSYNDGPTVSLTAIDTTSPDPKLPDLIEVVYASGAMTAAYSAANLTTALSLDVFDGRSFAIGDYVLVGDFQSAYLFKVSGRSDITTDKNHPNAATLSFGPLSGPVVPPATGVNLPPNPPVLKASTYTFFVMPSKIDTYANMLMVDPDGVASTNHLDFSKVQPAVDGVIDFQVAIGIDNNADGTPEEWIGDDDPGETLPGVPWNSSNVATPPQLRQVRLSLLLQTANKYAGAQPPLPQFEDRTSYPAVTSYAPRYRSVRMVVAPRAWNLGE